jgi:flavin-dependent dehydrogenase
VKGEREVLVVGAGPSGAAAAAVLARAGRDVLVLEKDRFPRRKVCGEFLSGSARGSLAHLDALAAVAGEAEPIERASIHPPGGRPVSFALPSAGFGISRARFDELLASAAAAAGAEVRFGVRVTGFEETDCGRVRVSVAGAGGREETIPGRAVVGAWGRWNALDRTLDRRFLRKGGRFFGWSGDYDAPADALRGEARLYLFPGGYAGLSRVEGGAVHLAGVIAERAQRRLGAGWGAVVAHARRSNPAFDRAMDLLRLRGGDGGFLGTGPVFFTRKPPAEGHLLMAGDAAGVIDPYLGEGLAIALESGILAGETLARAFAGDFGLSEAPRRYARDWDARFSDRVRRGAAGRALMLHPVAARVAAALAGERLVRLAMGSA